MSLKIDHNKFHDFLRDIYTSLPEGRIVWREDGHCNICEEISFPEKYLELQDFILLLVVFVGRLNYLIYLKQLVNRSDNAGLFLEDLFNGIYVETINGIKHHAPDLLKELKIEYNDEFRKISEVRNSAFHFPDDIKLFTERREQFNKFAKSKIHPFNENMIALQKYVQRISERFSDNPNFKAAFIHPTISNNSKDEKKM